MVRAKEHSVLFVRVRVTPVCALFWKVDQELLLM